MRRAFIGRRTRARFRIVGWTCFKTHNPLLQSLKLFTEIKHHAVLLLNVPLYVRKLFL
jgi:hypothetical protein